jgi:hypothetical protein
MKIDVHGLSTFLLVPSWDNPSTFNVQLGRAGRTADPVFWGEVVKSSLRGWYLHTEENLFKARARPVLIDVLVPS